MRPIMPDCDLILKGSALSHGSCYKVQKNHIFDTISGSQGIFGTCDTIMVFGDCRVGCRELHVTGRDIEQRSLAMRQTGFVWTLEGDAETVRLSARRREIVTVFQSAPDRVLTLREIREASGMNAGVMKNTLRLLTGIHRMRIFPSAETGDQT